MSHACGPMGAWDGWGGGNAVIEAAEAAEAAEAKAMFAFAFSAAPPHLVANASSVWPVVKGGTWQSKITLSEKSVFCRVLLENVFSSECSLV